MVFSVPQGTVLGPLVFLQNTIDLLMIRDNTLVDIAVDSTFLAGVPKPGYIVPAVSSLNRDLDRIGEY